MMKSHRLAIALILNISARNSFAINCKEAITTPDVNECAKQEQKVVEAKLNKVYQRVLSTLNQPNTETDSFSEMKRTLIEAQRAWVKFRQADCDAVFARNAGGTIRTVAFISCMQSRAERRIEELELYERE